MWKYNKIKIFQIIFVFISFLIVLIPCIVCLNKQQYYNINFNFDQNFSKYKVNQKFVDKWSNKWADCFLPDTIVDYPDGTKVGELDPTKYDTANKIMNGIIGDLSAKQLEVDTFYTLLESLRLGYTFINQINDYWTYELKDRDGTDQKYGDGIWKCPETNKNVLFKLDYFNKEKYGDTFKLNYGITLIDSKYSTNSYNETYYNFLCDICNVSTLSETGKCRYINYQTKNNNTYIENDNYTANTICAYNQVFDINSSNFVEFLYTMPEHHDCYSYISNPLNVNDALYNSELINTIYSLKIYNHKTNFFTQFPLFSQLNSPWSYCLNNNFICIKNTSMNYANIPGSSDSNHNFDGNYFSNPMVFW